MKKLISVIISLFLALFGFAQESVSDKNKIHWEIIICPSSSFRNYTNSNDGTIGYGFNIKWFDRKLADSVQIPKFTIAFGVNALKKISNHLFLSVGIDASDKGFKSKDYVVEYDSQIYNYGGGVTIQNYQTVNDNFNWWYLEMPIGIKYRTLPKNRVSYSASFALAPCLNILSSNSGVQFDEKPFDHLNPANGIMLSSTASAGIDIHSDVSVWSFAPTFKYGLTSATDPFLTKTFLYSYGLTIGLTLN